MKRLLLVFMVLTLASGGTAQAGLAAGSTFTDDNGNVHEGNIEAIAAVGITKGCNPPANDRYCPTDPVTRGQMAAFLGRALKLPSTTKDFFGDDNGSQFESAINALAAAGITHGCNPPSNTRYCPDGQITRGQMAAFLQRAFNYPSVAQDFFGDDNTSIFETAINAIRAAGITKGCNPPGNDRYCPGETVRRDQMASFLARALELEPPGVGTIPPGDNYYVDVNHSSASDSNPGTEASPWRTIVHAAAMADPGDSVWVKAGEYRNDDIIIGNSGVSISAYPGDERRVVIRQYGLISHGNSNLTINGLKFVESEAHAIRIVGPDAENIVITNNHTYDSYNSGISIRGVTGNADPGNYDNIRDVLVSGNLVELGTNGGGGEIISVGSGAVNVDIAFNEVRVGDPSLTGGDEGISFKEGVRDSRIFGNVIHDLSDKAISIDGGSSSHDPLVTNIEIFDNIIYDVPSHGMWITTEGQGDVDGVHIHHNVIYQVDHDGILVYQHPGGESDGGTVRNVLIEYNTVWDTGLEHNGFGGIRVNHPSAPGVVITNNIAWANNGYDIRGDVGTTITRNNLCAESSLCDVTSDPRFVDAPSSFKLQPTSPAIGAGTGGSNLGAR